MTEDTGFGDVMDDEPGVPSEKGESWGETAERLRTPDTLEDLHEYPWSAIEGAFVRVEQVRRQDVIELAPGEEQDTWTEEREGTIVGRSVGTGLYYDSRENAHVPTSIGPSIFLDTPEDTTLEVLTNEPGNELLAFDAGGEDGE